MPGINHIGKGLGLQGMPLGNLWHMKKWLLPRQDKEPLGN